MTPNTPHTVGHVGWSPNFKSSPMPPVNEKLIALRPYGDVCLDITASPMERETAMLTEWNATLRENSRLRGAMARLCLAVSRRMMPDDPTPEDRMELREAFDAASEFLND